jgi:hypothetical protein
MPIRELRSVQTPGRMRKYDLGEVMTQETIDLGITVGWPALLAIGVWIDGE